ncbi:hypothetical protein GGI25_002753 [Coemansia spiralis]|uniref:Rnh202 triple barrel domain-containing protein n=2 Tax=Coemansia TaxID=4863 RepID=A0A9W8G382_9FUNG|nr:hypothetical protein EDC05_002127 [Coemansia umbellata]KAJ2625256.1 hypothetical protein GGI26_000726 [Coemansia sp. RSA 1358]KAJ2677963.1 hypothetical protein GGI25_002753 [Coemansia spiralis]
MACQRKVLLVPKQQNGKALEQLRLPSPHTGELSSYYVDTQTETILEAAVVDMKGKRSWLGRDWVLGNGSAAILTPVDPLFIYLALLTKASMSGDDEWRFVDIDGMLLESHGNTDPESIRLLFSMKDSRKRALDALCVVRQISSDTQVVKLDVLKIIAWLKRKCDAARLPKTLSLAVVASLGVGANDELIRQAETREMALLVSEYLSEYWTNRLFAEFDGFVRVCQNESSQTKLAQSMVFDLPESYTQGIATPNAAKTVKQEKPKTAKEKQMEIAAKKSKSITSFFKKKAAP